MFQLDEFEKLDYTSQLTDLKNQVQLKEQQLGKTFFLLEQFDEKKKVLNSFFFSEQLKTQLCQKQELLEQEQNAEKETIAEDDVDAEESSGFIQTFENRLNIMQEEHDVYVDKCKLCSTQ